MSTDKVLDLGVMADYELSYDSHISSIVSKARFRSGIIFKSFHSHNISLLRQAFISFVRPILEYASKVWNPSILKYTAYLESVQRNFTYRIQSNKHLSYPERLAILNLEPLELRRVKTDLLMYYKILNNLIPISPDDHFTKRTDTFIHARASGTGLLLKPLCRSNRIGNHFFFRSIEAWNTLPSTITNASSPLMF